MNNRCLVILFLLASADAPIKIETLSRQLGVSQRTMRYTLEKIDLFLQENSEMYLCYDKNGVSLVKKDNVSAFSLFSSLNENIMENYFPSQSERILGIELLLLASERYITIAELSDKFDVSRSTMVADLNVARADLNQYGIVLQSMPRHGFVLQSTENVIRELNMQFLARLLSGMKTNRSGFDSIYFSSPIIQKIVKESFLDKLDIGNLYHITLGIEKILGYTWSDESFFRVFCIIGLADIRKGRSEALEFTQQELREICSTWDYKTLADNKELFGFDMDRNSLCHIVLYILAAETINISYYKKENQIKVQVVAANLIKNFSRNMGVRLDYDDVLQAQLSEFIYHAFYRIRYGINKTLLKVRDVSDSLIEAVEASSLLLIDFFGRALPDNELKYIAFVLDNAASNSKFSSRWYCSAILVTDLTRAETNEFITKINMIEDGIKINDILPSHQIHEAYRLKESDVLLSTVPLQIDDDEYILIDNLKNTNWLKNLKSYKSYHKSFYNKKQHLQGESIMKIMDIIRYNCTLKQFEKIKTFIEAAGLIEGEYDYERGEVMLKDLLTEDVIMLGASVETWEDCVRLGGSLMLRKGCIDSQFIEAMVGFVRDNGPYVVIAPGIALPHARPEDGAKKMGMSLVTLEKPVEFGNEDNDPVDLIISLAAIDNTSHLHALAELMEILGNEQCVDIIRSAKSAKDILSILKK